MGWNEGIPAFVVVAGPSSGLFVYSPSEGQGNLVASLSSFAGTDQFGNSFPAGISVTAGIMSGITMSASTLTNIILTASSIANSVLQNSTMNGGTADEVYIKFDSGGGYLEGFTSSTTTVTLTSGSTWTAPAGNYTSGKVECWGAGAGGGGGNSTNGGETGGGGEYAQEPSYPLVPGTVYGIGIGQGGAPGITGFPGSDGAPTFFDTSFIGGSGVQANGGEAGNDFLAGDGGSGSTNTIHFNGGNGANAGSSTGGSSGANSANENGVGNNGIQGSTSSGAAQPAAQTDSGRGGGGGADASNGSNGSVPGGAGGGAGSGTSSSTFTETFKPQATWSYYSNFGLRNTNGTCYHGAYSGEAPNYQYSYIQWATGNLGDALNSVLNETVNWVKLTLPNLHSWYDNGMRFGLHSSTTLGAGEGGYSVILNPGGTFIAEGATTTYTLSSGQWAPFQAGGVTYLVLSPDSSDLTNLSWYGYFNGGQNGGIELEVNFTVGGGSTGIAGTGANGQIRITYSSSSVLDLSASPVALTDTLGNSVPAGYMATLFTLIGGAAPAAPQSGWVQLFGDSNGNVDVNKSTGYQGQLNSSQVDLTSITVTAAAATAITKQWSIPANDFIRGTCYKLTCGGFGTQGSTVQNLTFNVVVGSLTNVFDTVIASSVFAASNAFHWRAEFYIFVWQVGSSGMFNGFSHISMGVAAAATGANQANAPSHAQNQAVNTTGAVPFYLTVSWASTTGAPTITAVGSILERMGT